MRNDKPRKDFTQVVNDRLDAFRRRQARRAASPDARRLAALDAVMRRMDAPEAARALAWLADKYILEIRFAPAEDPGNGPAEDL